MKKKKEFEMYLQNKFAFDYDVQQHMNNLGYFNDWLTENLMFDIIRTTTNTIYQYIKYLQSASIATGTINIRLNSLRKYFDCMVKLGYITRNPALGINIRGKENKVVENPLSETALNNLYQNFVVYIDTKPQSTNRTVEADNFTKQRHKLIVSLMVYQGLDTGELDRLNVTDINIKQCTVYIASKNSRNSRTLKLENAQILAFYQYLQSLPANQEKLFAMDVQSAMKYLLQYIKGVEPQVRNAEHIRQSRIMVWVSTLKLREAQHQIGHKYASSTECYLQQNTTELVDEINTLHLFK
jgi:site-specific recombinase XerD